MSISQLFPAISPSLSLNFARSKTLDPRITFSRTSTATRVNETGLIEVMSADEPRFDHKYENGVVKSLGLLVEEQRINYEVYTEDPTQWTIVNMVPTGNSVILPTGEVSTTIEYQGETTDPNSKLIRPLPTGSGITAGDTWVFSIFLKAGTEDTVNIGMQNNTATEGVRVNTFNMLTGEDSGIVESGGATNGEFDAIPYPNGWWRIYLRGTFANDAGGIQTIIRLQGFSNQVSVTTSFSAWGAQLEKASFMTSYIPNDTGSQKTRSPDEVSMTGTNFSDWYNQTEGTLFFIGNNQYVSTTNGNTKGFVTINDSTSNTRIDFRQRIIYSILSSNGTNVSWSGISTPTNITDITDSSFQKVGMAYSSNSHAQAQNGYLTRTSTTSIDPIDATRLAFFVRDGQTSPSGEVGGHISQLTYYPRRLTNEQLQNLTK